MLFVTKVQQCAADLHTPVHSVLSVPMSSRAVCVVARFRHHFRAIRQRNAMVLTTGPATGSVLCARKVCVRTRQAALVVCGVAQTTKPFMMASTTRRCRFRGKRAFDWRWHSSRQSSTPLNFIVSSCTNLSLSLSLFVNSWLREQNNVSLNSSGMNSK
eukprot:SAG31_NODE_3476_length_4230_cov_3.514645_2_plen_158_part_00